MADYKKRLDSIAKGIAGRAVGRVANKRNDMADRMYESIATERPMRGVARGATVGAIAKRMPKGAAGPAYPRRRQFGK